MSGGGGELEMEVAAAEAHFSAEDLASVGIGEATFSVVQIGDLATSRPSSVTVTIS
jgi:hypothetical protein